MNTVHISPTLDAERGPIATYARMIVLTTVLCVAVFAGFFAIGRSERPANAPREQLPSPVSTASAGLAIPARLASSPSIAVAVTAHSAQPERSTSGSAAKTSPALQPALPSAAPSTPEAAVTTPAAPAPSTPPPTPVSSAPASPQQTPAPTPPAPHTQSGSGKSESGGSTSFDSSG